MHPLAITCYNVTDVRHYYFCDKLERLKMSKINFLTNVCTSFLQKAVGELDTNTWDENALIFVLTKFVTKNIFSLSCKMSR